MCLPFSFAYLNCSTEYFFTVLASYIPAFTSETQFHDVYRKTAENVLNKVLFYKCQNENEPPITCYWITKFLLSSSKLPKSLFSCVIFSKVPILNLNVNTYGLYMSYLTYQCVLSDKRDMLIAVTSPYCFFLISNANFKMYSVIICILCFKLRIIAKFTFSA